MRRRNQQSTNGINRNYTCGIIGLALIASCFIGCASVTKKSVTLYPIEQTDIFAMEESQVYTAPKNGWFISDFWMEEVAKAKIQ